MSNNRLPCLYKQYTEDSFLRYDANDGTCVIVPAAEVPENVRVMPRAKLRLSLKAQADPAALRRYKNAIRDRSGVLDWDDENADFEKHFSFNPDSGHVTL